MKKYYVNNHAQPNGDHEVHQEDCIYLPVVSKTYLGQFTSCQSAVMEAKKHHRQVNGCKTCSRECHTQ
ncbi:MAG: hypothetical protein KA821_11355 [Chitinophagaceae bacterium]|nr:hypothetical protein [Chitinophagaceae bacterium]